MKGSDKEDRRRQVATGVVRVAAERGIEAVSLRTVAAEAGTSMGSIQYQFGTIADVVLFALEHVIAEIEAILEAASAETGQGRLKAMAQALLADEAHTVTTLRAYAQLRSGASHDPRISHRVSELHDRRVSEFESILEIARKRKLLHAMVVARPEADIFWTLMLAVAIEVAQRTRDRAEGLEALHYHFLRLGRNQKVTRPPRRTSD